MKQITLTELDFIKKTMGLTFSIHDGEALGALRKVNSVLQKHGLTWAEVLGRTVQSNGMGQPAASGEEMSVTEQTRRAFDELRGTLNGGFADFVTSLENQFERTGYLSPEQRRPLFNAVRQHRERRGRDA